jgi:hypothetical protein
MMTLKNKKYHVFLLILFILNSCNKEKSITNKQHKIECFDIIGNSCLDTLQIAEDIEKTNIFIIKNNKKKLLLKLYPLINNEFKTTNPTIENVYLESNNIQTEEKSLRVIVRNTDIQPDYYFIDVFLNCDEPKINNVGLMNSIDSVYIKTKKVKYFLKDVLDVNDGLNIRELTKTSF